MTYTIIHLKEVDENGAPTLCGTETRWEFITTDQIPNAWSVKLILDILMEHNEDLCTPCYGKMLVGAMN